MNECSCSSLYRLLRFTNCHIIYITFDFIKNSLLELRNWTDMGQALTDSARVGGHRTLRNYTRILLLDVAYSRTLFVANKQTKERR